MDSIFAQLESLIRAGALQPARAGLRSLLADRKKALSPEHALCAAELFRRTGLSEEGVRLLHPWVRPSARKEARAASPELKVEYAACLVNLYAVAESEELLDSIQGSPPPFAHFTRALGRIHVWDHAGAIVSLERYLATEKRDAYRRLIARVNLALCLVLTESETAEAVIEENKRLCRELDARLLMTNTLEMSAYHAFVRGDADRARGALAEAFGFLAGQALANRELFYLKKWEVLLDAQARPTPASRARAEAIRAQAEARRDFESVRELNFHLGEIFQDRGLLLRTYFGTPYAPFRDRVRAALTRSGFKIPNSWTDVLGSGKTKPIDLLEVLPPGKLLSRLASALLSDRYRAFTLHALHERVYPGSHFNPRSTPDQIHQLLRRFRLALEDAGLSLGVDESSGEYRLAGNASLVLRDESDPALATYLRALNARVSWPARSSDVATALGVSKPTAVKILASLIGAGELETAGVGPQRRYLRRRR